MKRPRFLFFLNSLFLLVFGLSACAGTAQPTIEPTVVASPIVPATSTPKVAPSMHGSGPTASSIRLEDCTIGTALARCGTYRVYENRSAHSGRQIDLKIAVLACAPVITSNPIHCSTLRAARAEQQPMSPQCSRPNSAS